MNRLLIIIAITLKTYLASASPQIGDYYIIGKDTFNINTYPLNDFFEEYQNSILTQKIKAEGIISLYSVRGYIATWSIENDSLFLINIDIDNKEDILKKTFGKNYKNGKVFAFWFSGDIYIPNGKRIRNNPYFRTYEKEILLHYRNGKQNYQKEIINYIKVKEGIPRYDNKKICDTLFYYISKNLDWEKLGKEFCDDDYLITINSKGKISRVKFVPILDTKWQNLMFSFEERRCRKLIYRSIKHLKFDILKVNGKPYSEEFGMSLLYDNDTKELKNYNN